MIKRETVVSLLAGFLVGALAISPVVAGDGFGFGAAQGAGGSGTATLTAIGLLTPTDGNVIVGDGSTWVAESGATARTSLGALGGDLGSTDNAILTADGTGGATAQGSDVTYDAGVMTLPAGGVVDVSATGALCLGTGANDVKLAKVSTGIAQVRAGNSSSVRDLSVRDLYVDSGGVVRGSAGSAATVAYQLNADANTGLFGTADSNVNMAVAGRTSKIVGRQVTLTDNTATTIATIALASGARCGGTVNWSVDVTDGTDHQVVTGSFTFSAVDKAGALTTDVDADATVSTAASAGTCTVTPTISDGTNAISLQITADTSLTPTAMLVRFNMDLSGTSAATVTLP